MIRLTPKHFLLACTLPVFGLASSMSPCHKHEVHKPVVKKKCKSSAQKSKVYKTSKTRVMNVTPTSNLWRWDAAWQKKDAERLYLMGRGNAPFVEVSFKPEIRQMTQHANLKSMANRLGHYPEAPMIQLNDTSRGAIWAFMPLDDKKGRYNRDNPRFPSQVSVVQGKSHVFAVYYNPEYTGGEIYALERQGGKVAWRLNFKGHQTGKTARHEMKLLLKQNQLRLYVREASGGYWQHIDPKTGALLQRRHVDASMTHPVWQPATLENAQLPKKSGSYQFDLKNQKTWHMAYPMRSNMVHNQQTMFVTNYGKGATSSVVYALNADSGDVQWAKTPRALREQVLLKTQGVRMEVQKDKVFLFIAREHRRTIEILNRNTGKTLGIVNLEK